MASPRAEDSKGDGPGLRPQSDADLVAGLVFVAFGLAFAIGSFNYELGTLAAMGPAYAPLMLALVLIGLGLGIVVKAYVAPDRSHPDERPSEDPDAPGLRFERVQWRPVVLITAAALFFAFTVDGLGLMPATFGTAAIATLAGRGVTLARVLVIATGLTVGSYLVFVLALQLRLPLLGDWLG